MDVNPTFGLLYIACYLFADREIYHSRGKALILFTV
jgi:hypothetical protein